MDAVPWHKLGWAKNVYLQSCPWNEKPIILGANWLITEWNPSREDVCFPGDNIGMSFFICLLPTIISSFSNTLVPENYNNKCHSNISMYMCELCSKVILKPWHYNQLLQCSIKMLTKPLVCSILTLYSQVYCWKLRLTPKINILKWCAHIDTIQLHTICNALSDMPVVILTRCVS